MLLRSPEDVPALVAIALSDFCRRADRPADAEEVRLALARLSPDEDAAVLRLSEGEPPATPLSPHAVIDLLRGLPAAEAARREAEGAYESIALQAREEAAQRAEPQAAGADMPAPAEAAPAAENPFAPSEESQRARLREAIAGAGGDLEKAADALGLEDGAALRLVARKLGILEEVLAATAPKPAPATRRKKKASPEIGPLRRTRAEVEALRAARAREQVREEEVAPQPRPGRRPAAPIFGRYVAGPAARRDYGELQSPAGKAILEEIVAELRANRSQILERLGASWVRRDGRPIGAGDLERLLRTHDLTDWFARVERENLRILLRQQRGHLPAVRAVLRVEGGELQRMIRRHGLESDLLELRERTREDARVERTLSERIHFAAEREDSLRDAGVLEEVDRHNLRELRAALEQAAGDGVSNDPDVVVELARRQQAIDPRIWRKAVRRYRLPVVAAEILGVPPPEEPTPPTPEPRRPPPRTSLPMRRKPGPRREIAVMRIGAPAEAPAGRPPRPHPGDRPGFRPGDRSGPRPGGRSGFRPDDRPGDRRATRPGERPPSRPGSRQGPRRDAPGGGPPGPRRQPPRDGGGPRDSRGRPGPGGRRPPPGKKRD